MTRDETICKLVLDGATMTAVAEQHGLTRERIRQIVLRDTGLSGTEIAAQFKERATQKRIADDFRDSVTATLTNNWTCSVCGGWNIRKGYSYIRGLDFESTKRCSHECTRLFARLRFRIDRDAFYGYQARSALNSKNSTKYQRQHAKNILDGTNTEHKERYYTRTGSGNEAAIARVIELRKTLRTEHLFADSLPTRKITTL